LNWRRLSSPRARCDVEDIQADHLAVGPDGPLGVRQDRRLARILSAFLAIACHEIVQFLARDFTALRGQHADQVALEDMVFVVV